MLSKEDTSAPSDDTRRTTRLRTVPDRGAVRCGAAAARRDPDALIADLHRLGRQSDLTTAEMVQAIAEFDAVEAWKATGAKDCVRWLCSELGLCRTLAYDRLRVARVLRDLPTLRSLFNEGELSWSKIRYLTRVATPDDEEALSIMALGCDADTVRERCEDYRWGKEQESPADEAEADRVRFDKRAFDVRPRSDGMVELRGVLTVEMAANLMRCLEHSEDTLYGKGGPSAGPNRPKAAQRRADALVAMSEASLSGRAANVSSADRHLVNVHVDAAALYAAQSEAAEQGNDPAHDQDAPLPMPLRAAIAGFMGGGITPSSARQLACDGSLVTLIMKHGEPIAMGRKQRTIKPATRRAVLARDGGCTFPGCGATRSLDVHHTTDWAFGGHTSTDVLCTLCRSCHTRVHAEGWRIERHPDAEQVHRPARAAELLANTDERTRSLVKTLDDRMPAFRFERPPIVRAADDAVSECVGRYTVGGQPANADPCTTSSTSTVIH